MAPGNPNCTRRPDLPGGLLESPCEKVGNEQAAIALHVVLHCLYFGSYFVLQQLRASLLWQFPLVKHIANLESTAELVLDGCAHGLRPPRWCAKDGDVGVKRPEMLLTNLPQLDCLCKRCAEGGSHRHSSAPDGDSSSVVSLHESLAWCVTYCQACVSAWESTKLVPVPMFL